MRRFVVALALSSVVACQPDFERRVSVIDAPRVLAVVAEPPEAAPGEKVVYQAVLADPTGTRNDVPLSWSYCVARKSLVEAGTVATRCLGDDPKAVVPVGDAATVTGTIPADACRLFGPELPPPVPGEPAGRPSDPDPTGGYYQPVRVAFGVDTGRALSFGATRITCAPSGVSQSVSAEARRRARRNTSPDPIFTVGALDAPADPHVKAGQPTTLYVRWPNCPLSDECGDGICGVDEDVKSCAADCTMPRGCGGAERYVVTVPSTDSIEVKRESVRVSWFTTAGSFAVDTTGTVPDEVANATTNVWTPPAGAGSATLWVVVRDDRGGASVREVKVVVE